MDIQSGHSLLDRIERTVFPEDSVSPFAKHVLIYYVTGNPGFIEYYRNLFDSLASALRKTGDSVYAKHRTQYYIHGASLAGFELASHHPAKVLDLNEIKRDLIADIQAEVQSVAASNAIKTSDVSVVLVGHSIGTWLILEAIVKLQKAASESISIAGAILLFPTVFDLAKSPNGLRFGWALRSEYSAFVISIMSQILLLLIPLSLLTAVISVLLNMPRHHALVTASMLKSRRLVEQALYMAHGELRQVKADTWSDELWGVEKAKAEDLARKSLAVATSSVKRPALYFYWGQNDHWVANRTRDAVIAQRAKTAIDGDALKPTMEIDKHHLPHAFTLVDGGADLVADKIVEWVGEIERRP